MPEKDDPVLLTWIFVTYYLFHFSPFSSRSPYTTWCSTCTSRIRQSPIYLTTRRPHIFPLTSPLPRAPCYAHPRHPRHIAFDMHIPTPFPSIPARYSNSRIASLISPSNTHIRSLHIISLPDIAPLYIAPQIVEILKIYVTPRCNPPRTGRIQRGTVDLCDRE